MSKAKTTNNGAMKTVTADLATIRTNFDGLKNKIKSLPDGKQKDGIMNAIEEVYLGTANAFRGFFAAPIDA